MSDPRRNAGDGAPTALDSQTLDALRAQLRGALCTAGDSEYDAARTIWNAMIDRRPAAIVRAAGAADVVAAVRFAKNEGLTLAIKGGGHNIAGNAVCDGGLMLDLSLMKSVRIDPVARTARVEPGAKLGDLDREAQAFGFATPLGINSTTGVAGLTLGGGFGWLSRKYGLTIDNLISADVVTAKGELVHASEKENPDLFWAIRGGGGNFGVVTSFEYKLHAVGPQVLAGLIVHKFSRAREVFEAYRKITATAPEELTCWVVLRRAPPLPFLPAEIHGREVFVLAMCWCGDLESGKKAIEPFRAIGDPIADVVGPSPYAGWQTAFDPLLAPGARNYWKSHDFTELSDGAIQLMIEAAGKLPTGDCEIFVGHLGGAINRVPATATAYPHRNVSYVMNVHTRWNDASQDKVCVAWGRDVFDRMAPHATGGVYVNFMPEDEAQRVRAGAYGPNFERLSKLKKTFDPENLFRMNQNIAPGA